MNIYYKIIGRFNPAFDLSNKNGETIGRKRYHNDTRNTNNSSIAYMDSNDSY